MLKLPINDVESEAAEASTTQVVERLQREAEIGKRLATHSSAALFGQATKSSFDQIAEATKRLQLVTHPGFEKLTQLAYSPVVGEALKAINSPGVQDALGATQKAMAGLKPVTDSLRPIFANENFLKATQAASQLGDIARDLDKQRRAFDSFRLHEGFDEPSPIRLPDIPPNPAYETNERLAELDERFERIEGLVVDAAEVANGLNAHAVVFLRKFEQAAAQNDRSAKTMKQLSIIMLVAAFLAIVVPIAYLEFWGAPAEEAATQAVIAELKAEVAEYRERQMQLLNQLAVDSRRRDENLVEALRAMSSVPDNELQSVIRNDGNLAP